jgi:hypothetical protein
MALTRKQIADGIDARIATVWQAIVDKQEAYFAKFGRYCQMRPGKRPSSKDKTGDTTVMTEFAEKIEAHLPAEATADFTFDTYRTPIGEHGFTLRLELTYGADVWVRCWSHGPLASERSRTWAKELTV